MYQHRLLMIVSASFCLLLSSCSEGEPSPCKDSDGDGFNALTSSCSSGRDCNDQRASVNPNATEACGDNIDNDCDGQKDENCENDACIDQDGDGFNKVTDECPSGRDCNDNDSEINPNADEICGNDIDNNCDGEKKKCPENCTDKDGDGFGIEGQNEDCPGEGVDCNDDNPNIHPEAEEVCDGIDNDCDGKVDDEDPDTCELDDAECSGTGEDARCLVGIGGGCNFDEDCRGDMRCDPETGTCRRIEGKKCTEDEDCLSGYACENDTCSGEFCDVTNCGETTPRAPFCNPDASQCVECPSFKENQDGNSECPNVEKCTYKGWCAKFVEVSSSAASSENPDLNQDHLTVTQTFIDCWRSNKALSDPQKDMCASFLVSESIDGTILEDELESDFNDGKFESVLSGDDHEALDDLWGEGFGDVQNLDWKSNINPGGFLETCVWFEPGTFKDELIVDKCTNFSL